MNTNWKTSLTLLAVLVTLFAVFIFSAGDGLASSISAIQERLRDLQVKVIKEKLKLLQGKVLDLGKEKPKDERPPAEPQPPTIEELSRSLEAQVKALEDVIRALKPRAVVEETARLEKRIAEINQELRTAGGSRLLELQEELKIVLKDYENLQKNVREALEESIKEKQVGLIREQIRVVKTKIQDLMLAPKKVSVPPPVSPDESAQKAQIELIQEQIRAVQLKVIKEQIKVIQERIKGFKPQ